MAGVTPTVLDDDWIGRLTQNAPNKKQDNMEMAPTFGRKPPIRMALFEDLEASNGFELPTFTHFQWPSSGAAWAQCTA